MNTMLENVHIDHLLDLVGLVLIILFHLINMNVVLEIVMYAMLLTVNTCLLKFLVYWYAKQEIKVRWGNTLSSSIKVGNGVKQGGILSPVLCNI